MKGGTPVRKLTPEQLSQKHQLAALHLAKLLFEVEGYHTRYLEEAEIQIRKAVSHVS